jgi:hypothetical protein
MPILGDDLAGVKPEVACISPKRESLAVWPGERTSLSSSQLGLPGIDRNKHERTEGKVNSPA